MSEKFSRTEMLIGADAVEKLSHSKVAVFGVGGVGGVKQVARDEQKVCPSVFCQTNERAEKLALFLASGFALRGAQPRKRTVKMQIGTM